jgi:NAD(P)-dependent dehydrogenase (short-subunit alcohol dehydrogenase family)
VCAVDVSDESAVATLMADMKVKYPRLDAAVLGAAIQYRSDLATMSSKQWREVIDINLNGVFHCLQGIVPLMKSQRAGAIVAFTSGLALTGWPGASAYAASKAALIGMIKSVAHELKAYNVRANMLSPGLRATPIFMDVSTEAEREFYNSSIGIGEPDGVVPTLLYLISDASANLTGVHRADPARRRAADRSAGEPHEGVDACLEPVPSPEHALPMGNWRQSDLKEIEMHRVVATILCLAWLCFGGVGDPAARAERRPKLTDVTFSLDFIVL